MAINPVTDIPSQLLIQAFQLKHDPGGVPDLKVGDRLEARVAQVLGENRLLVELRGSRIAAETTVPLQAGQKFQVRVEALAPQILLRLLMGDARGTEQARIADYLKAFRGDPEAFGRLFLTGNALLAEGFKDLPGGLLRDQSQALAQLIRTLIFSAETMKNPFFFRDFVVRSGFTLERYLRQQAGRQDPGAGMKGPANAQNLKSMLLKFGVDLREWMAAKADPVKGGTAQFLRLAEYADRSVHALETQQVLNLLAREQDNRYMMQLPFAFPQSLAMQDIFIEFGGGREQDDQDGAPFRIVFFLHLDVLGEMMIDVAICGETLSADLLCQTVDARSRVTAGLETLKANLDSLGFQVVRMHCDLREDLGPVRDDYIRKSSWFDGDVINFFA